MRLLSEFYNVEENDLLEKQIYEEELVSKNIKIKRMKSSIFLSFGIIGVLVITMVILGFIDNGVGNNHLLYNSIPVATINNEEIKYSEISSEYKIDSHDDYSLSEETSGWTLIQLHKLDIDVNGTFSIQNMRFSYVVIVLYAEFPDLKIYYYFLIDLR